MRFLTVFILCSLPMAAPTAAQISRFDDMPVTIEAEDGSLTDVLRELTQSVGANVICHGTEALRASVSLNGRKFGRAVNVLADSFDLIITVDGRTFAVRTLSGALEDCKRQLRQGRLYLVRRLTDCAMGRRPMYGSHQLRQKMARKLSTVLEQYSQDVLDAGTLQPEMAMAMAGLELQPAPQRAALAAYAIRGYLAGGDVNAALQVWQAHLRKDKPTAAARAWAELLAVLHHGGFSNVTDFWRESFDTDNALSVVDDLWQARKWQQALHFGRINAYYATAAGRLADAQQVQAAIRDHITSRRIIKVTCAVDAEATSDPAFESKVRARVERVSDIFQQAFNIEFHVVEILTWDPPSVPDFSRQRAALKAALGARDPELAIGFILEVFNTHPADLHLPHKDLWVGYGCPHTGPYLLTRDFAFEGVADYPGAQWTFTAEAVAQTLAHETAHLFGALHVDDSNSIMRPTSDPQGRALAFDPANRRVISAQKWKDLHEGLSSLDVPELISLLDSYRALTTLSAAPNGAIQEQARVHMALATIYDRRGRPDRARRHLEQILALGAPRDLVVEAETLLARG